MFLLLECCLQISFRLGILCVLSCILPGKDGVNLRQAYATNRTGSVVLTHLHARRQLHSRREAMIWC